MTPHSQQLPHGGLAFANHNYSVKDSQESLRFSQNNLRGVDHTASTKASKTQRIVQKSVDGKEARKHLEALPGREKLLWSQAQNVFASNNFSHRH